MANNALQRTGDIVAALVRAINGVRGLGRKRRSCLAAELVR